MKSESVISLLKKLSDKEISSVELTQSYIGEINTRNSEINAFISVTAESALINAAEADRKRMRGEPCGALNGIPFAVKDNICTAGIRTTCASRMLEHFIPPYSATAVSRLTSAGAIIIGKTNMDEFAMGSASDTSFFGAVKNPLNTAYTAGGSSGGSAAALAANTCAFALGSDTGGSVRQPASFCGLVGMKPTYGTVSRYGLIAFSSSLEQICPITKNVADNALLLELMHGRDNMDESTLDRSDSLIPEDSGVKGIKIGLPIKLLDTVDADISSAVLGAAEYLRAAGAELYECEFPDTDVALAAYYVISSAEASSNLSRFDGVRYGYTASGAESVDGLFTKNRTEAFGDEVKKRIILGSFCLSHGAREMYYEKALAAKINLRRDCEELLKKYDAVLLPIAPSAAYPLERKSADTLEHWRNDELCVIASLTGLPELAVPFGKTAGGMPTGVGFMGRAFEEKLLYKLGLAIEEGEVKYD